MEPVRRDHPVRARLVDRAVELVVPIGVHIDVTYRCDLDCVHCYLTDRKRDELTLHEYRRLFDDLRELGTLYLLVSGGEIFHRPDGLEILREARNRRFDVRIITHGGHIDDEVADALAEMKVTSVAMSIYASEPGIHDSVTRVPGSFERTIAAARALRQRGILVGFKFSVMRDNLHQIQATRALAAEVGAGIEISAHIRGDNEGSDALRDLRVDFDEQLAVADCVYSAIAGADTLPLFAPDDHTCLAGHASFYIGPDGTVTPCIDWEEAAGNIRDTPLATIWRESPLFERARLIRRSSFGGCSDCESISVCKLCPARSRRETGDPTASAPSKCEETMVKIISLAARRRRDAG